ncbi:TenA family protein [Falsirhodobacter halotolerans]|uniref:TenA family protein n=1 Tax=Falsirhodobacter halotolerans TaxID=1146892 RepID=UPI001FD46778|nr:TenA family protein [Falsirhodobacter halotolerans]MCJ8138995.1 TenA family protein [Falsirhodobacter halotolerans]
MSYGRTFPLWRDMAADWDAYTRAPFLAALADGSLPHATFHDYLAQDYRFLIHFSRAWGLGVAKAGSPAEMRACARMVHALMDTELSLHVDLCGKAGIPEAALIATEECAGTLAYTRFVMDAGYSGGFLDLLAALAPCIFGYGEVGARLMAGRYAPAYAPWIEAYGGAEYQDLCRSMAALLDRAVTDRLGDTPAAVPVWRDLGRTFATATTLEAGFWPRLG